MEGLGTGACGRVHGGEMRLQLSMGTLPAPWRSVRYMLIGLFLPLSSRYIWVSVSAISYSDVYTSLMNRWTNGSLGDLALTSGMGHKFSGLRSQPWEETVSETLRWMPSLSAFLTIFACLVGWLLV